MSSKNETAFFNPQQYPLRSVHTLSTKFESHFKPHFTLLCNNGTVSPFGHERPCLCNHLNLSRSSLKVHFSPTKPPEFLEFHNQNTRISLEHKSQPILAQQQQALTSSSGKQSPIGLVPRIPGNRERASAKHVLRPRVQK